MDHTETARPFQADYGWCREQVAAEVWVVQLGEVLGYDCVRQHDHAVHRGQQVTEG
jgi:hypothetical protein